MSKRKAIERGTCIHSYEFDELLGSGGYADVYKVRSITYGTYFVAKVMILSEEHANELWLTFNSEVSSLVRLNHPHIIRLYDYFREDNNFFLILEYCPGGTLMDKINSGEKLSNRKMVKISYQLISAISYSHMMQVAHRDIKPANILFDQYGRVKLADFGISCLHDNNHFMKNNQFSMYYASPEILEMKLQNPFLSDIWAMGVTLYVLANRMLPWGNISVNMLKSAMSNGEIKFRCELPKVIRCIINASLKYEPQNRIKIDTALTMIKEEYDKHKEPIQIAQSEQKTTIAECGGSSLKTFSGSFYGSSTCLMNQRSKSKFKLMKITSGNHTIKSDTFADVNDDSEDDFWK